ncbi:sugar phosphate isomerase/epimerase family protein [Candidatus Altiarchaeota archaeon]
MKIGAMNNPRNDPLEELAIFSDFGLDYIDLTIEAPEARPEKIAGMAGRIRKELTEHGMSIVCHMPWFLQITSPYDSIRKACVEEAQKVIEVAASLEAPHVTIHPDFLVLHRPKERIRELTHDSLAILADTARDAGTRVSFENFEKAHVSTDTMADIFRHLPELGFTLDVGHAFMGSKSIEHVRNLVKSFRDRLVHVHLHDNFGHLDDHLPLGAGKIDYRQVLEMIGKAGYDGTFTLEIHSQDRDYIRISKEKLEGLWSSVNGVA